MVSQHVLDLCCSSESVSSRLAQDPSLAPGSVIKELFEKHRSHKKRDGSDDTHVSTEDLEKAFACGNWGTTRPSELFLRIYHNVLCTLDEDPMVGMTSPSLLGSSGIVPLSIIAPLPDICRHMSNCIVRAEKEVFLATNFWKSSNASTLITNSLKELSRRAGERGQRIVVKIMYDRGNIKQVVDSHQIIGPGDYTGPNVRIPPPEEIPYIDLQVMNYHHPILGTFHCKFMVIDRRIAIIQSNNIQDNDNLEMMTHIEGPIVDSFYDMALCSWNKPLEPPLPSYSSPATSIWRSSSQQPSSVEQPEALIKGGGASHQETGSLDLNAGESNYLDPASKPVEHRDSLPEHSAKDPHYDPDIKAELARAQSVLVPSGPESRVNAVTRHLNTTIQPDTKGNAPDFASEDNMTPLVIHAAHDPVPMAMVCRKPWGAPNHSCVHVPQNAAFLSAVKHAKKSIFIQTPNLNAEPLLPALLEAVRRGVDVTYYVCLGYNDAGELLPFQGGTNEMVANKLYTSLTEEQKQHLHIFNYVAKDQTQPIHNSFKKRSCHIKILIADSHLGIQGNGNQDTQSWYQSQEANVMLDSAAICADWERALRNNQNTHLYGKVSLVDGCWRDAEGNLAPGALGVDMGHFSWAKGITGAVKRVRGEGGF